MNNTITSDALEQLTCIEEYALQREILNAMSWCRETRCTRPRRKDTHLAVGLQQAGQGVQCPARLPAAQSA